MSTRAATAVWLTPSDVAARLRVSRASAFRIMKHLPRFKDGRISRVSEEALNAYILERMRPAGAPDTSWEARMRSADALIRSYEAELRHRPRSTPELPARSDAPPRIPLTRPRETVDDRPAAKIRPTRPRERLK